MLLGICPTSLATTSSGKPLPVLGTLRSTSPSSIALLGDGRENVRFDLWLQTSGLGSARAITYIQAAQNTLARGIPVQVLVSVKTIVVGCSRLPPHIVLLAKQQDPQNPQMYHQFLSIGGFFVQAVLNPCPDGDAPAQVVLTQRAPVPSPEMVDMLHL